MFSFQIAGSVLSNSFKPRFIYLSLGAIFTKAYLGFAVQRGSGLHFLPAGQRFSAARRLNRLKINALRFSGQSNEPSGDVNGHSGETNDRAGDFNGSFREVNGRAGELSEPPGGINGRSGDFNTAFGDVNERTGDVNECSADLNGSSGEANGTFAEANYEL